MRAVALAGVCVFAVLLAACGGGQKLGPASSGEAPSKPAADAGDAGARTVTQVAAPIKGIKVVAAESDPPQYLAEIEFGLPDSCYSYGGVRSGRQGHNVNVEVTIVRTTGPNIRCAEIYRTAKRFVPIGGNFTAGDTYTVKANGRSTTFVAK